MGCGAKPRGLVGQVLKLMQCAGVGLPTNIMPPKGGSSLRVFPSRGGSRRLTGWGVCVVKVVMELCTKFVHGIFRLQTVK